jgi:hypothetical protein
MPRDQPTTRGRSRQRDVPPVERPPDAGSTDESFRARLKAIRGRCSAWFLLLAAAGGLHGWSGAWMIWTAVVLLGGVLLAQLATSWPAESPTAGKKLVVALVLLAGMFVGWALHGGSDRRPVHDSEPKFPQKAFQASVEGSTAVELALVGQLARDAEGGKSQPAPLPSASQGTTPSVTPAPGEHAKTPQVEPSGSAPGRSGDGSTNSDAVERAKSAKSATSTSKCKTTVASTPNASPQAGQQAQQRATSAPGSSETQTGGTRAPEEPAPVTVPSTPATTAAPEQSTATTPTTPAPPAVPEQTAPTTPTPTTPSAPVEPERSAPAVR